LSDNLLTGKRKKSSLGLLPCRRAAYDGGNNEPSNEAAIPEENHG
jgi:hypothetical protein